MNDQGDERVASKWAADELTPAQIFSAYVRESDLPPYEAQGRPFAALLPDGRTFWYSTREQAEQEIRRAVMQRILERTDP